MCATLFEAAAPPPPRGDRQGVVGGGECPLVNTCHQSSFIGRVWDVPMRARPPPTIAADKCLAHRIATAFSTCNISLVELHAGTAPQPGRCRPTLFPFATRPRECNKYNIYICVIYNIRLCTCAASVCVYECADDHEKSEVKRIEKRL